MPKVGSGDGVANIRVHRQSLEGVNSLDQIPNVKTIYIQHSNGFYKYQINKIMVDPEDSDAFYMNVVQEHNTPPTGSASSALAFTPYIVGKFKNSDFDSLLSNATEGKFSLKHQIVDNNRSQLTPTNLTAINNRTAGFAQVQDSSYEIESYTRSRYDGSKHTATALHTQSLDTGLVPISNPQTYFSYFNWLGGTSPNWGNNLNDRVAANIKYVISLDGETITPSNDAEGLNLSLIEQNFKTGEQATISLDSDSNAKFYSLNGTWDIFKSGKRIEPIIYSQTQSVQDNEVTGYGVADRLTFFSSNIPNSNVTSDMRFDATLEGGVEIKDSNVPFTVGLIEGFTGTHATLSGGDVANLDPADQNQSFTLTINARFYLNRTAFYKNIITVEIQKQVVTGGSPGPWTAIEQVVLDLQGAGTTDYTVEIEDTINDTTGTKEFSYRVRVVEVDKSSLAIAAEINPNHSYLKISQTPISANFATTSSAYWAVDSTDRTYVSASTGGTGLSTFYNHKQNDIEESGFTEIRYPFTIKEGDEIRFEATENFAYRINEVVREQPQLILKLDREVPENINTNMFLVRRYIDDPSSIILDVDKPAGGTSGGILKPKFLPSGSERQLQKVVQTLRRQNQI
jgi:hypothetical protein